MENMYSFALRIWFILLLLSFKLNFENLTANPKHSHFEVSKRKSCTTYMRSDLEALLYHQCSQQCPFYGKIELITG